MSTITGRKKIIPVSKRDCDNFIKIYRKKHGPGFATKAICDIYDIVKKNVKTNLGEKIKVSIKKDGLYTSKPFHNNMKFSSNGGSTLRKTNFWGYTMPIRFEELIRSLLNWIGNRFRFIVKTFTGISEPLLVSHMDTLPLEKLEEIDELYTKISYHKDNESDDNDENSTSFVEYISNITTLYNWLFNVFIQGKVGNFDDITREKESLLSEFTQWTLISKTKEYFNIVGRIITETYKYIKNMKDIIYSYIHSIMLYSIKGVSSIIENFSSEMRISEKKESPTTMTSLPLNTFGPIERIKRKMIKFFILYIQVTNKIAHSKMTRNEFAVNQITSSLLVKISRKFSQVIKELVNIIHVTTSDKIKMKFTEGIKKLSIFVNLSKFIPKDITEKATLPGIIIIKTLTRISNAVQNFIGNITNKTIYAMKTIMKVFIEGFMISGLVSKLYANWLSPLLDWESPEHFNLVRRLWEFSGYEIRRVVKREEKEVILEEEKSENKMDRLHNDIHEYMKNKKIVLNENDSSYSPSIDITEKQE
jgi:hypothetical protein